MIANIVTIEVNVIAVFELNQIKLLYLNFSDQTIAFICSVFIENTFVGFVTSSVV